MKCVCEAVFEFEGHEAVEYAREHLVQLEVNVVNWTTTYRCPDTERRWLEDSVYPEAQGGGPARLRQIDSTGRIMVWRSSDPSR